MRLHGKLYDANRNMKPSIFESQSSMSVMRLYTYNMYLNPFSFPSLSSSLSKRAFNRLRCARKNHSATIVNPCVAMQIAYERWYDGPQLNGHTYEPATLPSCEVALTIAIATARFDGGRAKVALTHAT
jgi:hypothetical protein